MTMFRSVVIFALLIVGSSGIFELEAFTPSQCSIDLNPLVILKFTPDPPTKDPSKAPATTEVPTNVPAVVHNVFTTCNKGILPVVRSIDTQFESVISGFLEPGTSHIYFSFILNECWV
jgi:hypothetical protein